MSILICLLSGVVVVFGLTHRLLDTYVVIKAVPTGTDTELLTTVLMVVLCVVCPLVPLILLIMGLTLGITSLLAFGALSTKQKRVFMVRQTDARVIGDD